MRRSVNGRATGGEGDEMDDSSAIELADMPILDSLHSTAVHHADGNRVLSHRCALSRVARALSAFGSWLSAH
jgi:hypothetical protein